MLFYVLILVQLPANVPGIMAKPSNYSVHLSWTPPTSEVSSYITHFLIYLNGILHKNLSRENGHQFTIRKLKPFTNYTVGIETQDGNFNKGGRESKQFKTKEAGKSLTNSEYFYQNTVKL